VDTVGQVSGDRACDSGRCYEAILARNAKPTIQPRTNARPSMAKDPPAHRVVRDAVLRHVKEEGRYPWRSSSGATRQSLADDCRDAGGTTTPLLDDPADPRDLGEWARTVGASKQTLTRLFTAQAGMSFRAWCQQRRLLRALELLAAGDGVTRSPRTGYDSASVFIAMFRRCVGTTPARYLEEAGGRSRPAGAPSERVLDGYDRAAPVCAT